jgi:hypothetical protein
MTMQPRATGSVKDGQEIRRSLGPARIAARAESIGRGSPGVHACYLSIVTTKTIRRCMLALLAAVLLGACAGDPTRSDEFGYDELLANLRARCLRVEEAGSVSQPFFSRPGRVLRVEGEDIQVFEYDTPSAASADAARVSADGGTVGTTHIDWIAPPHFFRRDRVIVLYVGQGAAVRAALESALGPQFAGR